MFAYMEVGVLNAPSPDENRMAQVGWSLLMVAEMPRRSGDDRLPARVQSACRESFYGHLRCLVAFLWWSDDDRDFNRHTFLRGWEMPDDSLSETLRGAQLMASQQVAHFSEKRVDADLQVRVDPERLHEIAGELLDAFGLYVSALGGNESKYAPRFRALLDDANRERGAIA